MVKDISEMKESVGDGIQMMGKLSNNKSEMTRHFKFFVGSTQKEGILGIKTKELVAVGTALTVRCKYCIVIHVEKAPKAGVNRDEISEVSMVGILMGGDPAMINIVEVKKKALNEFVPELVEQ
jgi:AhpD family alkylhydroperoxidase